MPHEVEGQLHWHEPAGLSPAGRLRYPRPPRAHDRFIAGEGVPVLRSAHVPSLMQVELLPWPRLGGSGAWVALHGNEGGLGCALQELAGSQASHPEKHLFEELVLVLAGMGTTELWQPGSHRRVVFEWQPGSLFAVPANALHRFVNAGTHPARLLMANTAPALLDLLGQADAVFANPALLAFDDDHGQAFDDIQPDAGGLAVCRTGLVPDAQGCDLPLDNRISPGWRQMQLAMAGPALSCVIGEHRPGRYARAQVLPADTAMVCLAGRGFSHVWPERLGPRPASVQRLDHAVHTLAGPGRERCYHQLFNTGPVPLRHLVVSLPARPLGPPGEEIGDPATTEIAEGGTMIGYAQEDPSLREMFASLLAERGIACRMRPDDYA